MQSVKRYLLITAGIVSLLLGAVGVLLPLLPTTPFLLLSSYCFIRSSERLYQWLIRHRIFGSYIYHYLEYRAVKRNAKIMALLLLWPSLLFSILIVGRRSVTIVLLLIGMGVSLHILSLRTYTGPQMPRKDHE
jgi:uncharacterized protein